MDYPTVQEFANKKVVAGICGILLGGFGVHKFVIGANTAGLVMLLSSVLTCGVVYTVMSVIGLIEGILYLTKSDEEFHREYAIEQKQWF